MPRGNDRAGALADLRGEYGATSGNAEDLIQAGRHGTSPELRAASLNQRDEEATKKLLESFDASAKKVDTSDNVLDLAVRGDYVVAVVETKESKRTYKVVQPRSDFSIAGPRRGSTVGAVESAVESEEEAAVREEHEARLQAAADAAKAEQEAAAAAQKAREAAAKKSSND